MSSNVANMQAFPAGRRMESHLSSMILKPLRSMFFRRSSRHHSSRALYASFADGGLPRGVERRVGLE